MSAPLRLVFAGLLLAPICLQCTSPTSPDPLVRFETCEELQVFLEDRLLHPEQLNSSSVVVGCADEALGRAPVPVEGGEDEVEPERTFTTTNTQEVDVDEPDFVKNDGDHIFVLRRGRMLIVDAWPPEQAHLVSETEIPGVPFTMFFDGDRAMVLSRVADTSPATTLVQLFDVSDRAIPVLRREVSVDATYVDARRVGDDVVLVTRADIDDDAVDLRTDPFSDDENRARLRSAGLDGLLPRLRDRVVGREERVTRAFACDDAYAPQRTPSTKIILAHSLSITDPEATIRSTAVVGTPGAVYASTANLYLVGTETFDGGQFTPDFSITRIHKLGAFDGARAPYLGSVVLEGRVKNELSVDEDAAGLLRVVITLNDDGNGDPLANQSALVVLEESGSLQLEEIARVDDIGNGEVIESVRFLGDRAYVVTFPSNDPAFAFDDNGFPRIPFTDPLFVIDLEDPRAPRLRGVLEVDGYSAYIHPIDADHLLTVGVRVDVDGDFDGLQLSIFDVSDLDAPTLSHRFLFGDQDAGTEALVERHAFTYFDELKTLALPFQRLEEEVVGESALLVFHVDVDAGFTLTGAMDQLPLYVETLDSFSADDALCGAVRRSVIMNDPELGPFVYAVSTAGITVAPLVDGTAQVASVAFRSAEVCDFSGTPL
ncbi:MAG: beta-propeller domain-containing protein [Deltaproteobacteria bacterium]|nr:beta-propeller domain-containing protein [Deltaproteobacteria bacterium]